MIDLKYSVAGALTGFIVGLTGVGGGALMTPALIFFFGHNPAMSVGTDLWFAAITKLFVGVGHLRSESVDWHVLKRMWLGSLPAALVVVLIVGMKGGQNMGWLTNLIAVVIFFTAVNMLFVPRAIKSVYIASEGRQSLITVLVGAFLGVCVTLTSIGAGALGSIFLLYLYPKRMKFHRLVSTDIVHAIPLAIIGGTAYLYAGLVDLKVLINLLLGSVPAVIAGNVLAGKISSRKLQVALGAVLIVVAIKSFKF